MAGHSKWANIQHRKGAQDKKRAKIFSKCSRAIISAVRQAGPDPDMNLTLRYAIDKARACNMPRDNIERAVKAGVGGGADQDYEEVLYEGYGPNGVAVMVHSLTNNRHRTAPEVKKVFERSGGNMGATGCVAHLFERKALFLLDQDLIAEDRIMELAIEWGADDVKADEGVWEVSGAPEAFSEIRSGLEAAGLTTRSAEVSMVPLNVVEVTDEQAAGKILKLMEALDDHDDVNNVYSNFEISEELLSRLA